MILSSAKSFKLLSNNEKIKTVYFLIFLLIASITELIGIGLILPILQMMSNQNNFINDLNNKFEFFSQNELILYTLIFFVIIFLVKNLFTLYFVYWQKQFSTEIYNSMATKLLKKYIFEDFLIHKLKNSSELINNVIVVSKRFSTLIFNILKLFSELAISISIILILSLANFTMTLTAVIIIILLAFVFVKTFRNISLNTGKNLQENEQKQIKTLQEIFLGLKDIKIKNMELKFLDLFNETTKKLSKNIYLQGTIIEIPKIWLEVMFVLLFSSFLIYFNINSISFEEKIPLLGLYVIATFRLLPSANKIISVFQDNIHLTPSLQKIHNAFEGTKVDMPEETYKKEFIIKFKKQLFVKNITFKYPNTKKNIFKNFSCNFFKNKFNLVIGKSGSGKSTLIDLIMGISFPQLGNIYADEYKISDNINNWQKKISYLGQSVFLLDDTIKNNIVFGTEFNKANKDQNDLFNEALKSSGLIEFVFKLENGLNTIVGERGTRLSGGQIQRIGIARELFRKSEILIFDESTSALDLDNELGILDCLKKLSLTKTIIFISHKTNLTQYSDNIINLDKQ